MNERVQRELVIPGSLADAWQAITDPQLMVAWLADEATVDLWPGGSASFRLGDEVRSGWIEEVSPPASDTGPALARLVFWWGPDDQPASRVELELARLTIDETRVRVVETRPLDILDLVGIPVPGSSNTNHGPALVAA